MENVILGFQTVHFRVWPRSGDQGQWAGTPSGLALWKTCQLLCFAVRTSPLRLPAMVATWAVECSFVEWRQNGVIWTENRRGGLVVWSSAELSKVQESLSALWKGERIPNTWQSAFAWSESNTAIHLLSAQQDGGCGRLKLAAGHFSTAATPNRSSKGLQIFALPYFLPTFLLLVLIHYEIFSTSL